MNFFGEQTLRQRITISVLSVIAILVLAQTGWSLAGFARALDDALRFEADARARTVSTDTLLQVAAWAGNRAGVDEQLGRAVNEGAAFAAVIDVDGAPGAVPALRGLRAHADLDVDVAQAAALSAFGASTGDDVVVARVEIPETKGVGDLGLLDEGQAQATRTKTFVVVGVDRAATRARLYEHAAMSFAFGLVALAVAVILVGRVFRSLFERVEALRDVAQALADGDLTVRVADAGDELGVVGAAVERMRRRWLTIVTEMRAVAERLGEASHRIQGDAAEVASGSLRQLRAADESGQRSAEIVEQSTRLAARVAAVASASTESQAALKEAREGTRTVAERVGDMRRALDENEVHRAELMALASRITEALVALSGAVDEAQRASRDVTSRMTDADRTASAIAQKAESALARSGDGLRLLGDQKKSYEGVVAVTERTRSATAALSTSMMDVLSMASLIGDIADMTSMLSLNASIIAAQAGGQSLGFATVADEIRTLAARTRQASAGIAERTAEAQRQIAVVASAVLGLSETVTATERSQRDTGDVLESVLASMQGALEDASGLAKLIGGAASRTANVSHAVAQTSQMQRSIEAALKEQRAAQARLDDSANALRQEADTVAALGTAENARTDALLQRAAKILAATEELVAASRAQTELATMIATTSTAVREVAQRHRDAVTAITGSVGELNQQTFALQGAVRSLRVE